MQLGGTKYAKTFNGDGSRNVWQYGTSVSDDTTHSPFAGTQTSKNENSVTQKKKG